jgi:hypothetical protein
VRKAPYTKLRVRPEPVTREDIEKEIEFRKSILTIYEPQIQKWMLLSIDELQKRLEELK